MATNEEIKAAREAAGETIPEHLRTPWAPPVTDERDAFLQAPPSYKTRSVEQLGGTSGVFVPGREPGPSEYSHGRGLMAPPGMQPPTAFDEKQAIMRTNPADPSATADYETTDHSHSLSGRYISRVREPEQDVQDMPMITEENEPRQVITPVCSICDISWPAHVQKARQQMYASLEDEEEPYEPTISLMTCIAVLKERNIGPQGPQGAQGPMGITGELP